MNKQSEKFRQMAPEQLRSQEQDLREELFRLRFQMSMGQTESVKKLRELRRDIARVQTILGEQNRAMGGN
jgi:large subunit ribosomal protein L29